MIAVASKVQRTVIDEAVSRYWKQVLAPEQEQDTGFLGEWFVTGNGFEGCCVVDRGQGSCRLLELRSHIGSVFITTIDNLTPIEEPPIPEKVKLPIWLGEPEIGDRVTWDGAPSWWNPNGERLSAIKNGYGIVDYWRNPIVYERLRIVIKLNWSVQ